MSVRIGSVELVGLGKPLPRNRAQAKDVLRKIAKFCGVERVYFVRITKASYGGLYKHENKSLIIVEQQGKYQTPMDLVTFRFFHELTHHLHREGGLFLAYYFEEVMIGRKKKKYTQNDRKRVALRAERHANQKACELAYEFFGMKMKPPEYSKEYLEQMRGDIFG